MRTLILLLLITASAQGQFMPFAMWKTSASAPAFTPTSIDTLSLWYAADAITGKSDGDTLFAWRNAGTGGADYDLIQLTGSKKPVYKSAYMGDKPSLYYDGSDDVMASGSVVAPFDYTHATIFQVAYDSGSNNCANIIWGDASPTVKILAVYSGTIYWDFGNETGSSGRFMAARPANWNRHWQLLECRRNVDSAQIKTGDTSRALSGGYTTPGWAAGTTKAVQFGWISWGGAFRGYVAEILVYRNALTLPQRSQVVAYLKQKYNIP